MSDAKFKMTKARTDLITLQPFFGALALRLKLVETDAVPVMGVDGKNLYYNKEKVEELPLVQVMGVIAHEVLHCALQHIFRRKRREHKKWNRSTDYVINAILLKERFSLPEDRLFDPQYDGMSAEEVYTKLPNDPEGSNGSESGWNFGACIDPSGDATSESEVNQLEREWTVATKQAALIAKDAGKLPGELRRLIDEELRPRIPWEKHLWNFMNQRKPGRTTWNKPNRRLAHTGLYVPAKKQIPTGDIVIAGDTSGSITPDELDQIGAEMQEIIRAIRPRKIHVIWCDSRIAAVDEFGEYDQFYLDPKGGGGTDFRPPFKYCEKNMIQPDAFIYMTDGYGPFPDEPPPYPVLWMINNDDIAPPWGEHLVLDI